MTLILNVLHKDFSILAADRRAFPASPIAALSDMAAPTPGGSIADDYEKITIVPRANLALGIAGYTHDHYYVPLLKTSTGIDDVLSRIRKHMEGFLQIHDRPRLAGVTSFMTKSGDSLIL